MKIDASFGQNGSHAEKIRIKHYMHVDISYRTQILLIYFTSS